MWLEKTESEDHSTGTSKPHLDLTEQRGFGLQTHDLPNMHSATPHRRKSSREIKPRTLIVTIHPELEQLNVAYKFI